MKKVLAALAIMMFVMTLGLAKPAVAQESTADTLAIETENCPSPGPDFRTFRGPNGECGYVEREGHPPISAEEPPQGESDPNGQVGEPITDESPPEPALEPAPKPHGKRTASSVAPTTADSPAAPAHRAPPTTTSVAPEQVIAPTTTSSVPPPPLAEEPAEVKAITDVRPVDEGPLAFAMVAAAFVCIAGLILLGMIIVRRRRA
ncbi:MAG TPA: hypothetical protein VK963_02735 [Candidatus Saccharimonadales bacterium]|nr:hypothetical protein [Candidatus Saccharimonadales bacterium]